MGLEIEMKYMLNLRRPSSQKKILPTRPTRPSALDFGEDADDDTEQEISRHAGKNRDLKQRMCQVHEEEDVSCTLLSEFLCYNPANRSGGSNGLRTPQSVFTTHSYIQPSKLLFLVKFMRKI
ncbi:hypothetical protein SSX86_022316 [Deinandra increscens subsp. villosa]|uniref:Uncharacterized protein n=1 Tax=Deinandra increscens subsp. villosa TaxID=3103831 RepID=A0AAP0GSB8_9ASTR